MKTKFVFAAILAGMMFFTACENAQKTAADAAIKSAHGVTGLNLYSSA